MDPLMMERLMNEENRDGNIPKIIPMNHLEYPGVIPSDQTLSDWAFWWMENKKRVLQHYSYLSLERNLKRILNEIGDQPLQSLNYFVIQKAIRALLEKGIPERSVTEAFNSLSQSLEVARRRRLLGFNPCACMQLPRINRRFREVPSMAEIAPLFERCMGTYMENLVPVAAYAALRKCEACGLSWRQVDFRKGSLLIDQEYREYRKDGRRVREISRRTKNGKSRRIYPPKEVFEYLERQKALQEKMRLKHPDLWNNPYGLVFTDEYGGWITRTIQESQYGKAREEAGFPLLRFHDLRHVGAHYKYEQTHDLWAVRDYLGHRFLGMTIQYLFTSRQKEENIRKLDDYYRGLLKQGGDGKND